MEGIIAIVVLAGLIVLFVVLIRYSQRINKRKIVWYQNWAIRLDLKHELVKYLFAKLNVLSGEIENCPVSIYEKIIGSGKNSSLHTFIEFSPNPFDYDFSIAKEGFFSKVGKSLGAKDIEFNDHEFDKTFLLKSKEENKFRALMDYRMQQALREIESDLTGHIISNNKVFTYSIMGGFTKEEKIADFEKILSFMRQLIRNRR